MNTKIFFILLGFVFFSGNVFAQTKEEVIEADIKRISFSDTKVTIKYELPANDFPSIDYMAALYITLKNEDLGEIKVGLEGDHGKVFPSNDLSLTWNFTEEGFIKSEIDNEDSVIKIIGKRKVPIQMSTISGPVNTPNINNPPAEAQKVKLPSVVAPTALLAVGAAVAGFGVVQELDAQKDYDYYRDNKNIDITLDGVLYTAAVRDQYLTDAEDKRKLGTTAMIAGGVVVGGSILFLMKKMKARKAAKKSLTVLPDVQFNNNGSTSVGVQVGFSF